MYVNSLKCNSHTVFVLTRETVSPKLSELNLIKSSSMKAKATLAQFRWHMASCVVVSVETCEFLE